MRFTHEETRPRIVGKGGTVKGSTYRPIWKEAQVHHAV